MIQNINLSREHAPVCIQHKNEQLLVLHDGVHGERGKQP